MAGSLAERELTMPHRAIRLPLWYGRNATPGVTDMTTAVQQAIALCCSGGTVDGCGELYAVSNVFLKSNMTLRNIRFITLPSAVDDVSPLNIGDDLRAGTAAYTASQTAPGITDVILDNVTIDGNRQNQTGITLRDGGRHGIKVAGYCRRITMRNVRAENCATDGLLIYRGLHAPTNLDSVQHSFDVLLDNCQFNGNRRHGMAAESFDGLTIRNSTFNGNGLDVRGGSVEGDLGALSLDLRYGNGIDFEGYGLGSRMTNLRLEGVTARGNSRDGILLMDTVDPAHDDFLPRGPVWLDRCDLDMGADHQNGEYCLTVTSTIANRANGSVFDRVMIRDCNLDGIVMFRSVARAQISGGVQTVPSAVVRGALDYATLQQVGIVSNQAGWSSSNSTLTTVAAA